MNTQSWNQIVTDIQVHKLYFRKWEYMLHYKIYRKKNLSKKRFFHFTMCILGPMLLIACVSRIKREVSNDSSDSRTQAFQSQQVELVNFNDKNNFQITCDSFSKGLNYSKQVVAVITEDWDTSIAKVQISHRAKQRWISDGTFDNARIGKNGLGWGIGIHKLESNSLTSESSGVHGLSNIELIYRVEGSEKSPAGIFSIGSSFGIEQKIEELERKKENNFYVLKENLHCVDDFKSSYYNQFVSTIEAGNRIIGLPYISEKEFSSSEHMIEFSKSLYQFGFIINHNTGPRNSKFMILKDGSVAPYGSCVFFHVSSPDNQGTAGCTSLPIFDLEKLFKWKQNNKYVLLIQLPLAQWSSLKQRCSDESNFFKSLEI